MTFWQNLSQLLKTFPKNLLNSKNYSLSNLTAFWEIFTPAVGQKIKKKTRQKNSWNHVKSISPNLKKYIFAIKFIFSHFRARWQFQHYEIIVLIIFFIARFIHGIWLFIHFYRCLALNLYSKMIMFALWTL